MGSITSPGAALAERPAEPTAEDIAEVEKTLGAGLKELASELRLIEAADYAAFIRVGQMANLRSLVHSSAELHFKPGTLELAELGEMELGWLLPPLITLPMKFRYGGVRVYFRLRLAALSAAVEVELIVAENGAVGEDLNRRLKNALQEASIVRRPPPND